MKILSVIRLKRKVNSLQNEIETLEKALKDGLYTSFIEYIDRQCEVENIKKQNKKLRAEIKELKKV